MSQYTTFMTRYDLEIAASWIHNVEDLSLHTSLAYLNTCPTRQLLSLVQPTIEGLDTSIYILPLGLNELRPNNEWLCFDEVVGYVCMLCGTKILTQPGCVKIILAHGKTQHADFFEEFVEYNTPDIFMAFGIAAKKYMNKYLTTNSNRRSEVLPLWQGWEGPEVITHLTCPASRH